MRVYKDTPFEFGFLPWQIEPPQWAAMFLVKATFDLVQGTCTIADEQLVTTGDVLHDDGDDPTLRYDNDFALFKPRGEWMLCGSAFSTMGPATVVPVGVEVAGRAKHMAVYGDRHWKPGVLGSVPTDPEPFEQMPLRWERAFGGPGYEPNPAGVGIAEVEIDGARVRALPNLEEIGKPLTSPEDRPAPAGMFPIPRMWAPRVALAGDYGGSYMDERWPWFPKDFDPRYFNAAPPDQQIEGYWRGDEPLVVRGLHREWGKVDTRLPGLYARCFIERTEAPPPAAPSAADPVPDEPPDPRAIPVPQLEEIRLALDTITIDSDQAKVVALWRGLINVRDGDLSDVATLFVAHEELGAAKTVADYARRLWELQVEEAEEWAALEAEEPPEEPPGDALALAPPEGAEAGGEEALAGLLAAVEPLLPRSNASAPEVAASLQESGEDVPEELATIEEPPPALEEDALPDSLRRLAYIIRRRLGKPFAGMDLTEAPLRGLDLSGVDFSEAVLVRADLRRCNLRGCVFDGAVLQDADASGSVCEEVSMCGAELGGSRFVNCFFAGSTIDEATALEATWHRVDLSGCSIQGTDFEASDLSSSLFRGTRFDGSDLSYCTLDASDLTGASLEDTALEGVSATQCNFERCRAKELRASEASNFSHSRFVLLDAPDSVWQDAILHGCDLSGANLARADLSRAKLAEVNLIRSELTEARFIGADLRGARLMQCNLMAASFEEADLRGADLRAANVFGAGFFHALTRGVLLDGANVGRTLLG